MRRDLINCNSSSSVVALTTSKNVDKDSDADNVELNEVENVDTNDADERDVEKDDLECYDFREARNKVYRYGNMSILDDVTLCPINDVTDLYFLFLEADFHWNIPIVIGGWSSTMHFSY